MTLETITVVVPAYNAASYLREALASVLTQSHPPYQVIVVDDGSTDGTAAIAAEFPGVVLVQQPNRGIGAARNAGASLAGQEFIAFLDADDVWPSDALEVLLSEARRSGADAVFGHVVQFGEGREDSVPAIGYLPGSGIIRRSAFERVGPFREDIRVGEFLDWWARAQESGVRCSTVPRTTLRRRIHATNTGITETDSRVDYTRVLRAALERRRQV